MPTPRPIFPKGRIAQPPIHRYTYAMSFYKQILVATALLASTYAHAQACLGAVPESVRITVEQDNWTILEPQDLSAADIPVWKNNHPGYCPGVATGNFHHNSDPTYVLALIQKTDQNVTEKVLVITLKKKKTETELVIPPTQLPAPRVVWSLPPRRYRGVDGANVAIPQASFAFEKLVGTSRQYYFQGSHLKSFLMSY